MFEYLESEARDLDTVTMVLDKGLGLHALQDLLAISAPYIQIIKFGWGTTSVIDADLIRKKIELIQARGIHACPGGTFCEIAYARNRVPEFFADLKALGFSCLEVSDGTVEMPPGAKLDLIRRARDEGFTVVSEIGRKTIEADDRLDVAARCREAEEEIEAGSWKVILEARESGSLGIFDAHGRVRESFVDDLTQRLDVTNVIFEAPRKHQQVWLIKRFGPGIHFGNIRPDDVVSLETLRRGLRADTFESVSVFA